MAFGLGGAIGAAIGGAISAAASANKNKGSSSSSQSSGSTRPSSSGTSSQNTTQTNQNNSSVSSSGNASTSGGRYSYIDSDGGTRYSNTNQDWASVYQDAISRGDVAQAQMALDMRAQKLGNDYDSWQSWAEGSLDRYIANRNQPAQEIEDNYTQMTGDYMQQYEGYMDALRKEQQAMVDANIAQLNAQKPQVQQAGALANQAAQQNYYALINPNGASAEQRAALGLSDSGLTESSQIAAGNAYLGAVNDNAQSVNDQLAQIDLAITQAQLSGDLATAQQLQSYYNTVLQQGMARAGNIASLGQWGLENAQNQTQLGVGNALAAAGLTGYYNGNQTMAGQQNAVTIEGQQISNQLQQLTYLIQQKYGMSLAAAELAAAELANKGADLNNVLTQLQIDYAKQNM